MRFRIPALLADVDSDHAPPPAQPSDHVGDLVSIDESVRMNYLNIRVQLAYVQGRASELVDGPKSRSLTMAERERRIALVERMQETWRNAIPPILKSDVAYQYFPEPVLKLTTALFQTDLLLTIVIHGLQWANESLITRLRSYNSSVPFADQQETTLANSQSALPAGWATCVERCRIGLQLSLQRKQSEYYIW
jgi:hypothetical protein